VRERAVRTAEDVAPSRRRDLADLGQQLRLEPCAEARALVTRVRDSNDRRACQVSLTASGSDLHGRFHDYVSRELNALAVDLPDRTARQLTAAMWQIVSAQDVSAIFGCAAPSLPE